MQKISVSLLKVLCFTQMMSGPTFANAPGGGAPKINQEIWQKIDQLNKNLRTSNGVDDKLAEALIEAEQIIKPENFDEEYQKIRAWSFEHDFKLADSLVKRADPAFELNFGGDYDIYKIRFGTFSKLAKPGGEMAQLLAEYPKYAHLVFSINPAINSSCTFEFNLTGTTKENAAEMKRPATSNWSTYTRNWKSPVLKAIAGRFSKCFEETVVKAAKP